MSRKVYIADDGTFEVRSGSYEPSYGVDKIKATRYPYILYIDNTKVELSDNQFNQFIELCLTLKDVPNTLKDDTSE